ncbi:hypothetical protein [Nocardia sp. AB354]|uniref:hypothetical protein n=1 Tax=Nocardia sp. AB354 TaxID=3413283 RepID=UPI003C29D7EE
MRIIVRATADRIFSVRVAHRDPRGAGSNRRQFVQVRQPGETRIDSVDQFRRDGDSLWWWQGLGVGGAPAGAGGEVSVPVELDGLEPLLVRRHPIDEYFLLEAPLVESDGLVQHRAPAAQVLRAVVVGGVAVAGGSQVDDDQVRVLGRGTVVDQQHHVVVGVGATGCLGVFPFVDQHGDAARPGLQRFGHFVQ